ncbi:unnamed protein product [Cuscuta epithymum]|uniref:cytokinin dehydrogenase n=1 Tax=Cuscuta epithymum TaxID=186058 RepID=A0AAV0DLE2_9ASTE|nr:unnamed protein product [Cuscuta epithymum]
MAKLASPTLYIFLFVLNRLVSILIKPWNSIIPNAILDHIADKFRVDSHAKTAAATDFGGRVQETPAAVLYPSSIDDIIDLVRFSYTFPSPFPIAARGHGHSVLGQASAKDGVVVNMGALAGGKIRVSWSDSLGYYADVAGGELWIDVLRACLPHGVAPVSWTDYLYLTVGGTLSNAGISGQAFRYGPQISNVLELDVITGMGEFITCSKDINSDLFFAVLGGLGQFGIITRARIVLKKAPTRAKWVRMLYDDFSKFTKDQEYLISVDEKEHGVDYLEGSLIMNQSSPNNWRSSFFSPSDRSKINPLLANNPIVYCLDAVKYFYDGNDDQNQEELLEGLMGDLEYVKGMKFKKEMAYFEFLNRVTSKDLEPQENGLWKASHPWLNLFVPKSSISDFNSGVFESIILKHNKKNSSSSGDPILVYPTTSKTWDDRMSVVIPEEETFYCVGMLYSCGINDWEGMNALNEETLKYCEEAGIKIKQYLPHFNTKQDWEKHFGKKWNSFQENKARFDPKMILSPGQAIFN